MQRGFNSAFLRGRSRFAESEFDDMATSLIRAFNILIYFLGQVSNFKNIFIERLAARLISTLGSPSDGRGQWIIIVILGPPKTHLISIGWQTEVQQEPRSWCDRIPIVVRSYPDRGAIVSRSRCDRDPIVARSGFLRG